MWARGSWLTQLTTGTPDTLSWTFPQNPDLPTPSYPRLAVAFYSHILLPLLFGPRNAWFHPLRTPGDKK